jgi:hypothetical protein
MRWFIAELSDRMIDDAIDPASAQGSCHPDRSAFGVFQREGYAYGVLQLPYEC